jgi:hypothetical protein
MRDACVTLGRMRDSGCGGLGVGSAGSVNGDANGALGGLLSVACDQPVEREAEDAGEGLRGLRLDSGSRSAFNQARVPFGEAGEPIELTGGEVHEPTSQTQPRRETVTHNNQGSRQLLALSRTPMTTHVVGAILPDISTRFERLEQLIRETAGRPADFARLIGVDARHVNAIRTRLQRPREDGSEASFEADMLAKMVEGTSVNPIWLMFGRGPERIDPSADPELTTFLARMTEDAQAAARAVRARVSEVKAVLALHEAGRIRTYTSKQSGDLDWARAIQDLRMGKLHASRGEMTDDGVRQAAVEQGPVPTKIKIPSGPKTRSGTRRG